MDGGEFESFIVLDVLFRRKRPQIELVIFPFMPLGILRSIDSTKRWGEAPFKVTARCWRFSGHA